MSHAGQLTVHSNRQLEIQLKVYINILYLATQQYPILKTVLLIKLLSWDTASFNVTYIQKTDLQTSNKHSQTKLK